MAETITVKQLADKVGIEARVLRRILRSQFPRETKGKAYEWQPDDLQIELIIQAVQDIKATPKSEKPEAQKPKAKAAKPKTPKVEAPTQGKVKFGEIDPNTGGVPIDLSCIGTAGDAKQDKTRQC